MTVYDDIMLKHGHAHQHLLHLQRLCREYLDPQPFQVSVEVDLTGLKYDMVIRNLVPVPSEIALTAGDAIHNARSVLDHLAWALADNGNIRTNFPIEETRHISGRPAAIAGVSNVQVQRVVETVQPYNQSAPADDLLLMLDQLDIDDKHKILLTTVAGSEGASHGMVETTTGDAQLTYFWGELREGKPFASVVFTSPPQSFSPTFRVHPYIGIRTANRPGDLFPAINLIFRILQHVATVVNQFKPYL